MGVRSVAQDILISPVGPGSMTGKRKKAEVCLPGAKPDPSTGKKAYQKLMTPLNTVVAGPVVLVTSPRWMMRGPPGVSTVTGDVTYPRR